MTTFHLDIRIDDTTRIAAHTDSAGSPAVMLDTVWLSVARDAHNVAVADALLTAVTKWHAEIHRRATGRTRAVDCPLHEECPPGCPVYETIAAERAEAGR